MNTHFSRSLFLSQRIRHHLIFWTLIFFTEWFVNGRASCAYDAYLVRQAASLGFVMAATYFTVYYLLPKYLLPKKYVYFGSLFILSALVLTLLLRLVLYTLVFPTYFPQQVQNYQWLSISQLFFTAFDMYAIVGIVATIKLVKHWYQHEHLNQKLEKDQLETELKFLRSQVHPHFLFNTLNNLYGLTIIGSPKAPQIVEKLSGLLRYTLYESNRTTVSLESELTYLQNYIALESIRFDERLELSLNLPKYAHGIQLAPMMLLPFIENAFKHGGGEQLDQVWIRIDLSIQAKQLVLKVENALPQNNPPETKPKEGIGLKNVRRRLELLYPNQHTLDIYTENDTYLVVFKLDVEPGFEVEKEEEIATLLNF